MHLSAVPLLDATNSTSITDWLSESLLMRWKFEKEAFDSTTETLPQKDPCQNSTEQQIVSLLAQEQDVK